jgi:hypothetical protein
MITFLVLDIFFALLQLFPRMTLVFFLFGYIVPYLTTCLSYLLISMKNPGYKATRTGLEMLEQLRDFYDNIDNSNSSIQKIKNVSTKFCFECNIVKKKTRHCEICNKCVENFDHHCPYVLNCIGKDNHKLFLFFLIVSTIFLVLRFILSLLSSANVICFPSHHYYAFNSNRSISSLVSNWYGSLASSSLDLLDSLSSGYSSKECLYNYDSLGRFGEMLKNLNENHLSVKVIVQIINWLHILLNLFVVVMVVILTKISLCNYIDGVTTWERHLRKHAQRDTSIDRELRQNFLDKKDNSN